MQFNPLRSSRSVTADNHPRENIIVRKVHTGSELLLLNDVFFKNIFQQNSLIINRVSYAAYLCLSFMGSGKN